jgi:poly-gamma-glutamate synthesis protein (capsule biosynthesis protein)
MVGSRIESEALEKKIQESASTSDYLIVNIHWGAEYSHEQNKTQIETAHLLIDAGADLIIGHHPHVVQGIEIYKGKPIFYSLGNFIFDQTFSLDTQQCLALDIRIDNLKKEAQILPISAHKLQISLDVQAEQDKRLAEIASWSELDAKQIEDLKNGLVRFE